MTAIHRSMQLCNLWEFWAIRPCSSNLLLHGQRKGHGLLTPPDFPRSNSPPLRQLASSHVEARLYSLGLPCLLPSDPIRLCLRHNNSWSLPCRATYTRSVAGKLHWFFFSSLPDTHIETGSTPTAWDQPSYYSTFPSPPSLRPTPHQPNTSPTSWDRYQQCGLTDKSYGRATGPEGNQLPNETEPVTLV